MLFITHLFYPFTYLKFGICIIPEVYLVNCSDENGKLNLTPRIVGGRRAHEGEFLGIVSEIISF